MPVTIEVPAGCKFCKRCGGVFPKDTHFSFNTKIRIRSGEAVREYRAECKSCQWEISRIKRAQAAAAKPRPEPTPPWPRCPTQRECDAALMGWRPVERVAFIGARL